MDGSRRTSRLSPGRARLVQRVVVTMAVAWTAAVVVALWMPPPEIVLPTPWLDKVTHLAMFAGVGGLWRWVYGRPLPVWVAAVALGMATEIGQGLLPWGRHADVADLGFDVLGAGLGVLVAGWIRPPWQTPPAQTTRAS